MSEHTNNLNSTVFEGLSSRQTEILTGRFGLGKSGGGMTLAALGAKYGVTRERVRQIEASALAHVNAKISANKELKNILEACRKFLKTNGGIITKDKMAAFLKTQKINLSENELSLLISASKAFFIHEEDEKYRSFYYLDKSTLEKPTRLIQDWISYLGKNKEVVISKKYSEALKTFINNQGAAKAQAVSIIGVSKDIHTNPYGDTGLAAWSEIKPSTIRDRIYIVLKKIGKPLHFEDIAKEINKIGFDTREALGATVHNELIKDSRFVLVGRGMYGLSEHGFTPGTAREVIHKILGNTGPLKPKEVIKQVQHERFLKPNTILVNLQNKDYFERLPDGRYKVRQA